jgi:hypothetical protein
MSNGWRPYNNPDLGRSGAPGGLHSPSGALPSDIRAGDTQPAGTIGFDKIIRRSYLAPPTTGVTLALFTMGQDQVKGLITFWGLGCPQFDWFGTNEYFLAVNGAPPMDQQLEIAGGPGPAGSFYGGVPVGTLQAPKICHIPLRVADQVSLVIAPQTTPAAGTVVYNIWTRIGGYIWR